MLTREDLEEATRIVRAHVPVTPAYRWPLLEDVTGVPTWVKHENVNPTGPSRSAVDWRSSIACCESDPPRPSW